MEMFDKTAFMAMEDTPEAKRIREMMHKKVDEMIATENRIKDEAVKESLRQHGYDVIQWHRYTNEKPTLEDNYLVSIKYEDDSMVKIAWYSKNYGLELDESGDDYWVSKDIRSGKAAIVAWAELPQPFRMI